MLGRPQQEVCLRCHGGRADLDRAVAEGFLSPGSRPALLSSVLSMPSLHPVSSTAFGRGEDREVVCTSCHSPHRSTPPGRGTANAEGNRYPSPMKADVLELELCEGCHGGLGVTTDSRLDVSRFFAPTNVSHHPVEAPASQRSPSVKPNLAGRFVNCTDCHGSDDPSGARGLHGSRTHKLLSRSYTTVDGAGESEVRHPHPAVVLKRCPGMTPVQIIFLNGHLKTKNLFHVRP